MSDFQMVRGFEDVWRPPVRPRSIRPESLLRAHAGGSGSARARLSRLVHGAPEVMVKVTGRTRDGAHLRAHLDYISRNGEFELEGADGVVLIGRRDVADLADDWAAAALHDRRRRKDSPLSLSVVLSMPEGTNALALREAARAFAADLFAGRHDYVFTLHTDTPRPHVHLSICSRGHAGQRLNPKKEDLELWRQTFAQALRDRGVEAEATPRRARGVTRKAERGPLRRMRERYEAGGAGPAVVARAAYQEAARVAFRSHAARTPWELRMLERQQAIRALYLAQALLLGRSRDPVDRALGKEIDGFVRSMPVPDSRRLALARELRALARGEGRHEAGRERDRQR